MGPETLFFGVMHSMPFFHDVGATQLIGPSQKKFHLVFLGLAIFLGPPGE